MTDRANVERPLGTWLCILACVVAACAGDSASDRKGGGGSGGAPGTGEGAGATGGSGFDNGTGSPTETHVPPDAGSENLTEDNCGVEDFVLHAKNPVDVHIVLDKSESMDGSWQNDPTQTRWTSVKAVLSDVLTGLEDKIRFGLALYPWAEPGSCNCLPGYMEDPANAQKCCNVDGCNAMCSTGDVCNTVEANVEVAAFNAKPIIVAMEAAKPDGSTPTRHAVLDATAYLEKLASPNPKYILLASDGSPNCRAGHGGMAEVCPFDATPDDKSPLFGPCCRGGVCDVVRVYNEEVDTVLAIKAAHDKGIKTYVVGMALPAGLTNYDAILSYSVNQGAVVGGTARKDGPPYYYPVEDGDELKKALLEIAGQLIGCEYVLEAQPPDPTNMLLIINGMEVPRDATGSNGWELSGPDAGGQYTIELFGPACDAIKNAPAATITAYLGCPNEPIPSPI